MRYPQIAALLTPGLGTHGIVRAMPRTNQRALALIGEVAAAQEGLITAAQLAEIGYARNSVLHRVRQGGPWMRVLPGVYLTSTGSLTASQRRMAAVLYAKAPCALTGMDALALQGVTSARRLITPEVHLLTPHSRRRISRDFVRIERTIHWPTVRVVDGLPTAGIARAVVDACRQLHRASDVIEVATEVLRSGRADVTALREELRIGQRQRTALLRDALDVLERGPASVAEVDLYRLWMDADLPESWWNVDLLTADGSFIARPDVYLPDSGVAFELDSLRYHYNRADWEHTMERHARMTSHGLLVIHATPARIRADWPGVQRLILRAVRSRAGQPAPEVRVRGAKPA